MSRKKNFTAKLVKDAPLQEKHDAAIYGDTRTVETMQIVEGWGNYVVFYDEGGWDRMAALGAPANKALDRKNRKRVRGLILAHLEIELTKASKSGDGSFFAKLAADFEAHKYPDDPARARLASLRLIHPNLRLKTKTLRAVAEAAQGRPMNERTAKRLRKELGFPKGEGGRPAKR